MGHFFPNGPYDGVYRLENFDRGDLNVGKTAIVGTAAREEDFTIDATGNWTDYTQKTSGNNDLVQQRDHNKVNEIDTNEAHDDAPGASITASTGTNWDDPVHDGVGNMTQLPNPASLGNGLTCTYDAWNRLVEVEDASANTMGKYEYDGLNRRIKKHYDTSAPAEPDGTVDVFTHYYYSKRWQVLETRDSSSENTGPESVQPKYDYFWSLRYIDAPLERGENTDNDGACDDDWLCYLVDANFNVTCLIDPASGVVRERYAYDPYGKVAVYAADWSSTTASQDNTYLYTGREYDEETGFYHYRNRYYHAELGRFVSRDPIGYAGGDMNLYAYVSGNPGRYVDPHGTQPAFNFQALPEDLWVS